MPKKIFKIDQFHGGLNNNSDPRDIADNELAGANDLMVDNLGKIRTMGSSVTHAQAPSNAVAITGGYGLFQFSHDRTGGNVVAADLSGTHTGSNNEVVELTDSAAAFTSVLVGATVNNTTDGSSGTVVSVDSGTVLTLDDLTGGTGDEWDNGDAYTITTFPETGDDYLAMADTGTSQIDIYSKATDTWSTNILDLGSATSGMQAVFHIVDGVLRVCDGEFENSSTNKWYGYIKRTHFSGLNPGGAPALYDGWFNKDQGIAPPTRGLLGSTTNGTVQGTTTAGTTTSLVDAGNFDDVTADDIDGKGYIAWNGTDESYATVLTWEDEDELTTTSTDDWYNGGASNFRILPPAGTGFTVHWVEASPSASLHWGDGDTYELATTFIYDGNQESLPYKLAGENMVLADNKYPILYIWSTSPYNPRISGSRIYYRTADSSDPWKLIADIDMEKGARPNLDVSYNEWIDTGAGLFPEDGIFGRTYAGGKEKNTLVTYDILNGISQTSTTLNAQYKTAVVANRMVYIGNVKIDDIVYGDMMIKSPVNKFDIFVKERGIEASVRDGDGIVKLEEYADRILQFKKSKMHLINVSQEIEFLEDTFIGKGVTHPAATCKTDFGIAWVNREGVYLYDGQKVNNLLEKAGRQIIRESSWHVLGTTDGFIDSSDLANPDEPMIGYLPKKRQLIVSADVGNTGGDDTDIFLYDMVTQSWVSGDSKIPSAATGSITNFIIDWNRDLTWAYSTSGVVQSWSDVSVASGPSDFLLTTKDIDFGFPGVRKKIYKAYISFKGNGTQVNVKYSVNGSTDVTPAFYRVNADGSSDNTTSDATPLSTDVGTNDWVLGELKPVASINNVYSFLLRLSGTAGADFEINDISIVYRLKGIK